MGLLACAEAAELDRFWAEYDPKPNYDMLRQPETGLVMVRGRAGGTGQRFNMGEMTMTRCSVSVGDDTVGHAFVAGCDARHAELAALFDALLQTDEHHAHLREFLIGPLETRRQREARHSAAATQATKVEFFTLVRGEDDGPESEDEE